MASAKERIEVVRACLDAGFAPSTPPTSRSESPWARPCAPWAGDEAAIIAWNFFLDFAPGQDVGGADYYRPEHIAMMLDQLQTDRIEYLVVHALDDPRRNKLQEELAVRWQQDGYVKQLGVWHPEADAEAVFGEDNPYSFMVRPYNVTTRDADDAFAATRRLGWRNFACSPFVRGWELDKLVTKALASGGGDEAGTRAKLADAMIRYSLFAPNVDRLIVSIRQAKWVALDAQLPQGSVAGGAAGLAGGIGMPAVKVALLGAGSYVFGPACCGSSISTIGSRASSWR